VELEKLRLTFEADTGSAAANLKTLEKMILAQVRAMNAATNASKEHESVSARQIAMAAQVAAKAAQTSLAMTEQAKRTAASSKAFQSQVAQMTRSATANARAASESAGYAARLAATKRMTDAVTASAAKYDQVMRGGLNNALAQTASHTAALTEKKKKLIDVLFGAAQKAFFFGSVLGHVGSAFQRVFSLVEDAARTNSAKRYFEDAGKSLDHLRQVSNNMMSDSDLMKKANLADSMGLDNGTFDNLIKVAQAAATKTGQSFDHMFDSIVLGTARSSRLLLDNLGIIVNVGEANRKYAAQAIKDNRAKGMSIDAVVESMSAEAKQLAFLEEMQRATVDQLAQFEKLGAGGAATFDQFAAAVSNLKTAVGTGLIPIFSDLLGTLTRIMQRITSILSADLSDMQKDATGYTFAGKTVSAVRPLSGGVVEKDAAQVVNEFKRIGTQIATELARSGLLLKDGSNLRDDGTLAFVEAGQDVTEATRQSIISSNKLIATFNAFNQKFQMVVKKAGGGAKPLFGEDPPGGGGKGGKGRLDGEEEIPFSQISRMYDPGTLSGKWAADAAKQREEFKKTQAEMAKKLTDDMQGLWDLWQDAWAAAAKDRIGAAKDFLTERSSGAMLGGGGDQNFADRQQLARDQRAWEDQRAASGVDTAASIAGAAQSGKGEDVIKVVSSVIGAALGGPALGLALGNLLGPLLGPLEGLADIAVGLMDGLGLLLKHGVEPFLSVLSLLEDPLRQLLASVGLLIGAALRPLIPLFTYLVGIVALVITAVAGIVTVLAPFIELIAELAFMFATLTGTGWLNFFAGGADAMAVFVSAMKWASDSILTAAIGANNSMVEMVRSIGRALKNDYLKGWGNKLTLQDFEMPSEPPPEGGNDDALDENTRALRDLARELHNLPSGYKGSAAMYNASDNEAGRTNRNVIRESAKDRTNNLMPRILNPFR
jgi:hypothetical protein